MRTISGGIALSRSSRMTESGKGMPMSSSVRYPGAAILIRFGFERLMPVPASAISALSSGVRPTLTQVDSGAAYAFRQTVAPGGIGAEGHRRANKGRWASNSESIGLIASTSRASV